MEDSFPESLYHSAVDAPLMILFYLFALGAIYGFLAFTCETKDSNLKKPFGKFSFSCLCTVGWYYLYDIAYSRCGHQTSITWCLLIISYISSVIAVCRFIKCIYIGYKNTHFYDDVEKRKAAETNSGSKPLSTVILLISGTILGGAVIFGILAFFLQFLGILTALPTPIQNICLIAIKVIVAVITYSPLILMVVIIVANISAKRKKKK